MNRKLQMPYQMQKVKEFCAALEAAMLKNIGHTFCDVLRDIAADETVYGLGGEQWTRDPTDAEMLEAARAYR